MQLAFPEYFRLICTLFAFQPFEPKMLSKVQMFFFCRHRKLRFRLFACASETWQEWRNNMILLLLIMQLLEVNKQKLIIVIPLFVYLF